MVVSADERMFDMWTMIGAILGSTTRLKVASGIYLLALRHPLQSARACLTAHQMSRGRFMLGVGVGWLPDEFKALGVPFENRARRFEEILDVLPRLFAGGPVASDGPLYPFASLQLTQEPATIPLLFGGTAAPAIRRAALRGDGWYGTTIPLEECIAIRNEIERVRREHGLDRKPFEFICRLVGPVTRENVASYNDAGFEHVVLPWESIHPSGQADMSLEAKFRSLEHVARTLRLAA
jgi:alkanesulfonate monooxygenase SsuD/methylene tetrahydromethanopterin reductase-like flavin-dependent oxidoreductase (luciferase family)